MRTNASLILAVVVFVFVIGQAHAQMFDDDVDGLKLTPINGTTSRLTWIAVPDVPCDFSITYSVFRSTAKDFEPSERNQVATGLSRPVFVAHDSPGVESYYHVRAVRRAIYCAPPAVYSGSIVVFPLDLGGYLSGRSGFGCRELSSVFNFTVGL